MRFGQLCWYDHAKGVEVGSSLYNNHAHRNVGGRGCLSLEHPSMISRAYDDFHS